MTNKEQLAADLFASFQDFQTNAPTPGGSRQANQYVADKLADAIAEGIERGSRISFKGAKTVAEINYLPSDQKQAGDMYLCTTSGRLDGKNPLEVNENTAVIWDGASWHKFIEIDLSDYYTKEEVDGAVSLLQAEIGEHKEDTSNPHQVTAEQVGADPAGTAERLVEEHNLSEDSHLDIRQAILDESDARQAADETLQGNIDAETSAREDTDRDLQAQIDAISSRSDVVDVVASYAELVAYDTSTLADNDVIKVLADETHEDAIAYYRWSTTTEAWSFIGSQGPYYTISETDTLLAGKVDKVSGKGLSTNDYTTAEKNKLAGIAEGADKSPVKFFSYSADYADIAAAMPYASHIYNVFLVGKEDGTYPRSYSLVKFDRTNEVMVFAAMRDDSTLCTITKKRALGTGWTYRDYPLAPQSHASSDTTYGTSTSSNYGHVKLSDSTGSTSDVNDGIAATPKAVKAAYDLANGKYTKPSGGIPDSDIASASTWNGKQGAITGAATTITSSNLTASMALVSNSSGKVAVSAVTSTELGYMDGVTSNVQSQLNGKVPASRTVNGHALSSDVTVTKGDVGLGNVGNFKAVSTVASQGLTAAEQSNARNNIQAVVAYNGFNSSNHSSTKNAVVLARLTGNFILSGMVNQIYGWASDSTAIGANIHFAARKTGSYVYSSISGISAGMWNTDFGFCKKTENGEEVYYILAYATANSRYRWMAVDSDTGVEFYESSTVVNKNDYTDVGWTRKGILALPKTGTAGSSIKPIYIDTDGKVTECDGDVILRLTSLGTDTAEFDSAKSYMQSGGIVSYSDGAFTYYATSYKSSDPKTITFAATSVSTSNSSFRVQYVEWVRGSAGVLHVAGKAYSALSADTSSSSEHADTSSSSEKLRKSIGGTDVDFAFDSSSSATKPKLALYGSQDPQLGVFATTATSGTSAHGVQLDADVSGENRVGVWGYHGGKSDWVCYKGSDAICGLGAPYKNSRNPGDQVVRLGRYLVDFSGTVGTDANTIYFL